MNGFGPIAGILGTGIALTAAAGVTGAVLRQMNPKKKKSVGSGKKKSQKKPTRKSCKRKSKK